MDSDFADSSDNEGEIAFAFMNITDQPVTLAKNEKLGQGIFAEFLTTENDEANGERIGGFGSTDKK